MESSSNRSASNSYQTPTSSTSGKSVPPPLTPDETKAGITDLHDPRRECFSKDASSTKAKLSTGRDVAKSAAATHVSEAAHATGENDAAESVVSGYADNYESARATTPSLDERAIEPLHEDYDPTIVKKTEEGVNPDERAKLLEVRAGTIATIRQIKAKMWMLENVDRMLQCLIDPNFAEEEGFRIVLDIDGKSVQIAPPLEGQGVPEDVIQSYADYIYNSLIKTRDSIGGIKDLRKTLKLSTKRLKTARNRLKKEAGIHIDLKAEKKWIENTRITLTLKNGVGIVDGGRQPSSYIPERLLHKKQNNGLKPDGLFVKTDSDPAESAVPSNPARSRYARRPADYDADESGSDSGLVGLSNMSPWSRASYPITPSEAPSEGDDEVNGFSFNSDTTVIAAPVPRVEPKNDDGSGESGSPLVGDQSNNEDEGD